MWTNYSQYQNNKSQTQQNNSKPPEIYDPACPTDDPAPTPSYHPSQPQQHSPSGMWPPQLRAYVERAFSQCSNEVERNTIEVNLKKIIIANTSSGQSLWSVDWDSLQLPSTRALMMNNKLNPNNSKKRALPTLTVTNSFQSNKQKRFKRFGEITKVQVISHVSDSSNLDSDNPFDPELIIKGTSTDLEKQYLRLTSAPDPASVRPKHILQKSLTHILSKFANSDYSLVCEQLKSIRQDLTVQHIFDTFAIEVYEIHSRLALEAGDLGEYNQCQSQLVALYEREGNEDSCSNEREFLAYRILYLMLRNEKADMSYLLHAVGGTGSKATRGGTGKGEVEHAVKCWKSLERFDYVEFFGLCKTVPNLGGKILNFFIEKVRISTMKIITRVYRPDVSVEWLSEQLGFDKEEDCKLWLEEKNASFVGEDKLELDCKKTSSEFNKLAGYSASL